LLAIISKQLNCLQVRLSIKVTASIINLVLMAFKSPTKITVLQKLVSIKERDEPPDGIPGGDDPIITRQ
jgi:hypothetical protein